MWSKRVSARGVGGGLPGRRESTRGLVSRKVLDPVLASDAGLVATLRSKAATMAGIHSPHCVRFLELVEDGPLMAIASELVDGALLQAVLERNGWLTAPEQGTLRGGASAPPGAGGTFSFTSPIDPNSPSVTICSTRPGGVKVCTGGLPATPNIAAGDVSLYVGRYGPNALDFVM